MDWAAEVSSAIRQVVQVAGGLYCRHSPPLLDPTNQGKRTLSTN